MHSLTAHSEWSNYDDADLLQAAARQDQAAFAEIINRYHASAYRLAWRLLNGHAECEDVAQEAFVRLWKNPAQVREAKALKGWLMRVVSNLAMDRLRKKSHDELDEVAEISDPHLNAEQDLSKLEATRRVDRAIAGLPDRQKLAVTLTYFEGLSNSAAADAMEISVDAFESLLSRGRRALKQSLAEEWHSLLEELAHEA